MSRTGITYQEVAQIVLDLEQKGEKPTIDKIRQLLGGTGSNTTISKFLQKCRNQIVHQENKIATPDIVQAAVDRVWQDLRLQTDKEIEQIKAEAQQLVNDSEKKAELFEASYEAMKSEYQQLKDMYNAAYAEKELLKLDLRSHNEAHTLLQTQYTDLRKSFADMETATSKHLADLANAHLSELDRLGQTNKSQAEENKKVIDLLKDQHEKERQNHIVLLDNTRVENKKLFEELQKLQAQVRDVEGENTHLQSEIKIFHIEKENIVKSLEEHKKNWSYFNDKVLMSEQLVDKLYDAPKLDEWLEKYNLKMNESFSQRFKELINKFEQLAIRNKKELENG